VRRPPLNLRRERVDLSTDPIAGYAPSSPKCRSRAGAKQNVVPNTDKPPYRCRARPGRCWRRRAIRTERLLGVRSLLYAERHYAPPS
jgi:hypothetical protein